VNRSNKYFSATNKKNLIVGENNQHNQTSLSEQLNFYKSAPVLPDEERKTTAIDEALSDGSGGAFGATEAVNE